MNLTDHFLIAVPGMMDDSFDQSVVYICEHNDQGALGLVINKPIVELNLQQLFDKVELRLPDQVLGDTPVYYGGPVHTERGFVLHDAKKNIVDPDQEVIPSLYTATLQVTTELKMTSSQDILDAIAAGYGPEHFLITLGYSGWGAGQLEEELMRNCWLTVKAKPEIIFNQLPQERYHAALKLLGVEPHMLVNAVGHA